MAHLKRRSNGRWQARYRDREHREQAKDFRTKPKAQAWLDEQIASLVRGDYVHPRAGRRTVGDMAETWLARAGLKPSTRADYRGVLDAHVLPDGGGLSSVR